MINISICLFFSKTSNMPLYLEASDRISHLERCFQLFSGGEKGTTIIEVNSAMHQVKSKTLDLLNQLPDRESQCVCG